MARLKTLSPYDEVALRGILERQKRLAWDFDKAIAWDRPLDLTRPFVPLDAESLVFPRATPAQRLAISQYLGLVIAQTFAEMEKALVAAKDRVWRKRLEMYPINPEFTALGEQFFDEEAKHSRMFKRYLTKFARATGVEDRQLQGLLPVVSGTLLLRTLELNSVYGGHALWWVLTLVEEVSVAIFKQMRPFRDALEPTYFEIHRLHFEEEVRHSPYSYWMLEHLYKRDTSLAAILWRKTDLLLAQGLEVAWALSSLTRLRRVLFLRGRHPFYKTLSSCLPLLIRLSPVEIIRRLFVSAPFVSLLLNPNYHGDFQTVVEQLRALEFPIPKPDPKRLAA